MIVRKPETKTLKTPECVFPNMADRRLSVEGQHLEVTREAAEYYRKDPDAMFQMNQWLFDENHKLQKRIEHLEALLANQSAQMETLNKVTNKIKANQIKATATTTTTPNKGRKRTKKDLKITESDSESDMQLSDDETRRSSQQKLVNTTTQVEGSVSMPPVANEDLKQEKQPKVPSVVLKNAMNGPWCAVNSGSAVLTTPRQK